MGIAERVFLVVLLMAFTACSAPPAQVEGASLSAAARSVQPTDSAARISRYIRCMFQDRDGALWLGTGEGLYRSVGDAFEPVTKRSIIGS